MAQATDGGSLAPLSAQTARGPPLAACGFQAFLKPVCGSQRSMSQPMTEQQSCSTHAHAVKPGLWL